MCCSSPPVDYRVISSGSRLSLLCDVPFDRANVTCQTSSTFERLAWSPRDCNVAARQRASALA
jgi:hypothetical protein